MPHGEPTGKRAALAVHRRLMGAGEMRAWPYCEWAECPYPAMETLELRLAADGTRLLRPFHLCSRHAEALPLPVYRFVPPAPSGPQST